jgi:hypothetical protein
MSGDDLGFQKLTPELLLDRWRSLRDRLGSPGLHLLASLESNPDDATLERGFRQLYDLERRTGVTLWHPLQLCLPGENPAAVPDRLRLEAADAATRERLLSTWHVRRWLVTMMSTAGHAQDTAINLVDIALRLHRDGFGPHTAFFLISNKYEGSDTNRPSQLRYTDGEFGQRARLAELLQHLSPGTRAHVVHDWTPFGFKAGGMVGMDLVPEESLRLTHMLVLDRNANVHDVDSLMLDVRDALLDPGTVIVVPGRGTTNTRTPVGQGSQALEEGHRAMLLGLHAVGGAAAECLGTGWGNLQVVGYGAVQRALVHPATRRMPLTSRLRRGATFAEQCEGLIGFGPHAVGISEDIWGVTQAAHNAIALGTRVRFGLSRAFWHKIRECWSHAEWLAAFPRWSGGFVQLLHDPLMQRLVDSGPLSIFAREVRMNGGRFYLGAPFALLNILILPISVLGDFSPFVEILAWLWLLGLVMSQVLTLNGLVARIDAHGFRLSHALFGLLPGVLAGTALAVEWPDTLSAAPLLPAVCFILGGFATPALRWLSERGRDLLLFGPQLVIHVLGQLIRQSLEFVVSGAAANDAKCVNMAFRTIAGPREDRPWERYPNLVNLRSTVWFIGLPLFVFNVFALSRLDLLNVLLLLPVLLFGASVLAGPFLLAPNPGGPSRIRSWVARLAAWIAAALLYLAAGWCIAAGGPWIVLGLVLTAGALFALLTNATRYLGYHRRLRRLGQEFGSALIAAGLEPAAARRLASDATRGAAPDKERLTATLTAAGAAPDRIAAVFRLLDERLTAWLKRPVRDETSRWTHRSPVASEFARAFVLAALFQLWIFVVPVPESLVVTAGSHQLGFRLAGVTLTALAIFGGLLLAGAIARVLEQRQIRHHHGLQTRLENGYAAYRSLRQAQPLPPQIESSVLALLTDAVTYLDQGSVGFARQSLEKVEAALGRLRSG